MNDAVCVCCGHGTPADGWLCRTCLDSGETWDDSPPSPMEIAWAQRVSRYDACVMCGYGAPSDGALCLACVERVARAVAWAQHVSDAHPVFAEREDARRWVP